MKMKIGEEGFAVCGWQMHVGQRQATDRLVRMGRTRRRVRFKPFRAGKEQGVWTNVPRLSERLFERLSVFQVVQFQPYNLALVRSMFVL
jgi:hypothetical protein